MPSMERRTGPESQIRVVGSVVLVGKAIEYGHDFGAVIWGHVNQCRADGHGGVR